MKIKEVLDQMEKANKFISLVGDAEYKAFICLDDYDTKTFKNYKEFKKFLFAEYISAYCEKVLDLDIELDSKGCADISFSYMYQFGNRFQEQTGCSLHLAISRY